MKGVLFRLLARRALAGLAGAHLAGLVLLGLVTLVERGDPAQIPAIWAALAPVCALVGGAWTEARLRQQGGLLALAACGWSPRWSWLAVGLAGALTTLPATTLLTGGPQRLTRVDGGWWAEEASRPDVADGLLAAPAPERHPWRPLLGGTAAAAGAAAVGAAVGPLPWVLTVAGGTLVADVLARGATPEGRHPGAAAPALLLLLGLGLRAGALTRAGEPLSRYR